MKTKDELNALKNEYETLNAKLAELSEEELKEVAGGIETANFKGKFKVVYYGNFDSNE